MLNPREVGVVARREILRNLRSAKGIAMFAIFFLGGFLLVLGRLGLDKLLPNATDESKRRAFVLALENLYKDEATVKYLSGSPPLILLLFQGTLIFLPLFVLMVGFDNVVGEVQHRTLRYSATRASRASILVGKAVGIWGVMIVMISVLHLTSWVVVLVADARDSGNVLAWGAKFLLFSCVAATAYVGFTTLASTLFRTPIVALFGGGVIGFAIWLLNLRLSLYPSTEALTWAFPNHYETLLILPEPAKVALGLGLLVAWGAATLGGAFLLLNAKDV